ncbi:hypothetical protein LTR97_002882 [Elasticomyces elasticus]|uniref:Uncharacterized protein n=1 Tax=Elasticomyces elasticus TaxID=574655 RepID=A0AAN7WFQ8_9PEZI|nr:hypothetical protein LTR97_002882 [Elasticomyces elasticus]
MYIYQTVIGKVAVHQYIRENAMEDSKEKDIHNLLSTLRCWRDGEEVVTYGSDSKCASMMWVGGHDDLQDPLKCRYTTIVDVIYPGELGDVNKLVDEHFNCDADEIRTVIIIELPVLPMGEATIQIFRGDDDGYDRSRSGSFRLPNGEIGDTNFKLSVADFIPRKQSLKEVEDMVIELDAKEMCKRLERSEKQQQHQLEQKEHSASQGSGLGSKYVRPGHYAARESSVGEPMEGVAVSHADSVLSLIEVVEGGYETDEGDM